MAIKPVNRVLQSIGQSARALYRAILVARATEDGTAGRLAFIQAKGRGDPDDPTDGELVQETDLDHIQHYGFHSFPPADTELAIAELDGGEAVLGERAEVPSAVPALASGDAGLWCVGGHYVQLDNDGNLIVEPASGKFVLLGDGATKKICLDGDDCMSNAKFDTWAAAVEAGIPTGTPPAALWGTTASMADVKSSATKAKGE